MRRLLVALLVLLAGCGGPAASDVATDSTPTATPAPVPTSGAAYPPGVTPEQVNATRLAAATADTIAGTEYTLVFDRLRGVPDQSLTTTFVGPRVRLQVARPDRYVLTNATVTSRGTGFAVERVETATFATGDRLLRYDGANTTGRPQRAADAGVGSRLVAAVVARYLAVESVRVGLLANGSARLTGRGIDRSDWREYTVRALVARDGTVVRLTATFAAGETRRRVRFTLDRRGQFEPPAWARNRTTTPAG
ncbi:hypothetical protein [Halosegnis sp.]|uniref:hypothetical protein n=1 Tax=Halosegnis sp. TaxID=2864959 RepID=UPI0035D418F1